MLANSIQSHLKKPEEKDYEKNAFFEQRANNELERNNYYLHQRAKLISINNEGKELANYFIPKMHQSIEDCGIGLAHPQYPRENDAMNPLAIFIIECAQDNIPFEAFINPIIVGYANNITTFPHGCLSAIGYPRAEMSSYSEILIAYYPPSLDQIIVKKFTEFAAVIVQHELTHIMQNETYIDVISKNFNGDQHKINQYINQSDKLRNKSEKEIVDQDIISDTNKPHIQPSSQDILSLISNETLAKCKHFLESNHLYHEAVNKYLTEHTEDLPLYNNLMSLLANDLELYLD